MSHWYALDGTPTYELKGANGKMRPTTLRDAKKLKLVPSVTTVMSVQEKPALLIWKQNQLLEAVLGNPINPFADEVDIGKWKQVVLKTSNDVGRKAAENGTLIHDNIELHIKTGFSKLEVISEPVVEYLLTHFDGFEWVAEDSFSHPIGFGGKIDLYGVKDKGKPSERRMVLDFKTKAKSKEEMEKMKAYDDHHLQTAAYVKGLEDTKDFGSKLDYSKWERYNLFIGYELIRDLLRMENGIPIMGKEYFKFTGLKLTESKDFEREWGMFEKLLEFWQLKNNYKP